MIEDYLSSFRPIEQLPIEELWQEMDRVWEDLGLDNKQPLSTQSQSIKEFYGHPVWILNGLFSELDPVSRSHRIAISEAISRLEAHRIADFGGGSGFLARLICSRIDGATVDIVEPYPFQIFSERIATHVRINYVADLGTGYDLLVAQDVLEHVEDPIELTIQLVQAARRHGYIIFASNFYPVIKCHIPSTFYLRHQFKWLLRICGAEYVGRVPGAAHALIFRKRNGFMEQRLRKMSRVAIPTGRVINLVCNASSILKRTVW
jgi:2-polyprenyl-6-hydroxyphenyl methylase/3-demethylubiquinone-9 3-methyltransferase